MVRFTSLKQVLRQQLFIKCELKSFARKVGNIGTSGFVVWVATDLPLTAHRGAAWQPSSAQNAARSNTPHCLGSRVDGAR